MTQSCSQFSPRTGSQESSTLLASNWFPAMWELLQLHLLQKQLVSDCNAGWHSPKINKPVLIVLSLPHSIPLSAQVPFLARFPGGSITWPGAWGAAHCLDTWPGTGPRSLSAAGRTGQCSLCQQKGNSPVRLCNPVPRAPRDRGSPQNDAAGTACSQQWLQHGLSLTTSACYKEKHSTPDHWTLPPHPQLFSLVRRSHTENSLSKPLPFAPLTFRTVLPLLWVCLWLLGKGIIRRTWKQNSIFYNQQDLWKCSFEHRGSKLCLPHNRKRLCSQGG